VGCGLKQACNKIHSALEIVRWRVFIQFQCKTGHGIWRWSRSPPWIKRVNNTSRRHHHVAVSAPHKRLKH